MPLTPETQNLAGDHLPFARSIAVKFASRTRGINRDDVFSEAYVGLCVAAERFEPERGTKFSTYAWGYIRGAILDWLEKEGRASYTAREQVSEDQADSAAGPAEEAELRDEVEFVQANLSRTRMGRASHPRLSGAGISAEAGISSSASCQRVKKARRILEEMEREYLCAN